ncbi:MAG: DNA mismatch repair protein MutS [Bdellovibrionota bacterium]|nr:DNA mismatch repair protein MutS [Bdellovibrionota bacterium]
MSKASKSEKKLTPLMEQYWGVKSAHPDKIIFFRMGDFFEIFDKDAEIAAPILGIALTVRNKKSGDNTKMCGMPHHSISNAVAKLLNANFKVAICDQLEDPKQAKGLVKRGITRILTPGMVFDPDSLDAGSSNYIACCVDSSMALVDTSTGECFYYEDISLKQRKDLIYLLNPAELLLSEKDYEEFLADKKSVSGPHLSKLVPTNEENKDKVCEKLQDFSLSENGILKLLFSYLVEMQNEEILQLIKKPMKRTFQKYLALSASSVEHLEIFVDSLGNGTQSLFQKINRCKSSIGSRRLRSYLSVPLVEKQEIEARFEQVEYWQKDLGKDNFSRASLREELAKVGDPERRLSKAMGPSAGPRDLLSLSSSLLSCLEIIEQLDSFDEYEDFKKFLCDLEENIVDEPPISLSKGYFLRKGVNEKLDEYIGLTENAQDLLREMEAKERESNSIPSLKIRYNAVFGYYIEVTKTHQDKVPDHYQRKQTLANSERYTTEELKSLERKLLSAKSKRESLEAEMFSAYREVFRQNTDLIASLTDRVADLDVFSGFAELAIERSYVRPNFVGANEKIEIIQAKHPVLEQELGVSFVANDMILEPSACVLLTGPNMAGKSTIMRQLALLSIAAQVGCFVPAQSAKMRVFEQIFTRIGASDSLSEGLSTFMVEMKETADILEALCPNSLVLMDEVGRGTSTYDGMSLAQAILEHLLKESKATVLFSTHYHELTSLESDFPKLENRHMSIRELDGKVHFLHQWTKGPANKSYGIHVAKLAGLPKSLTKRAERILKELELQNDGQFSLLAFSNDNSDSIELSNVGPELEQLKASLEEIRNLKIQEMTPLELMTTIGKWQSQNSSI